MLIGVTPPFPSQITDIRSSSVSKHAQQSFPRFRMRPRGVRLFVGQSFPRSRASRTEEKKGKSGSTNGAHGSGDSFVETPFSADFATRAAESKRSTAKKDAISARMRDGRNSMAKTLGQRPRLPLGFLPPCKS